MSIARRKKEKDKVKNKENNRLKTHSGIVYSMGAKMVAMVVMIISIAVAIVGIGSGICLIEEQAYTTSKDRFIEGFLKNKAWSEAYSIVYRYCGSEDITIEEAQANIDEYVEAKNYAVVITENGEIGYSFGDLETAYSVDFTFDFVPEHYFTYDSDEQAESSVYDSNEQEESDISVQLSIYEEMTEVDEISLLTQMISLAYGLRYWVWFIAIVAACVAVGMFVFLLCVAGYRRGAEEITPWGLDRIPTDLYTGMVALGMFFVFWVFIVGAANIIYSDLWVVLIVGICIVVEAVIGMLYCMSIATRIKVRTLFSNTILYRVMVFTGGCFKNLGQMLGLLMQNLPLVLKVMPIYIFCSFLGLYGVFVWNGGVRIILWIFVNMIAFAIVLYVCMMVGQLKKASKKMAEGDLIAQVDTKYMVLDFQEIGKDMNQIATGMSIAVEERMKSERFKTELITNVGHDIKTPLTSIINYTDLIGKEEVENPRIQEYTGILLRQSERLKRLIEDLVEASKASTGNVEVYLAPCDIGVLLTQAVGEYEEKLKNAQLTIITTKPEEPVTITADGRLLWRVFDNLLNNICKYAQEGTRVYLAVMQHNNEVRIEFKNISRYELNITEDELMERFIRGDKSRHSEGNGLGLSIAKSLVEVQGGTMNLSIDGDLYKVILKF